MKLNIPKEVILPAFKNGIPVRAVSARALKKHNPSVFTEKYGRDGYDFASIGLEQFAQDGKSVAALLLLDDVVRVFDELPDNFIMPANKRHQSNSDENPACKQSYLSIQIHREIRRIRLLLNELVSYWRPQWPTEPFEATNLMIAYNDLKSRLHIDNHILSLFKSKGIDVIDTENMIPEAHCPFCDATGHTVEINDEKGFWHCFACGESGDDVKFMQRIEKCSFVDALAKLTEFIKQNYTKEQEQ